MIERFTLNKYAASIRQISDGGKDLKTVPMTSALYNYVIDHTDLPHPILEDLEIETARHPMARMQISRDQGMFMHLLVKMLGAKKCLEIGCFTGYSAICMASALPADGRLITLDIDVNATAIAARYFKHAGLDDRIELILGNAKTTLQTFAKTNAGQFDLVFIDADKEAMPIYFERALEILRPGGIVLADNVMWSGRVVDHNDQSDHTIAIRKFNDLVMNDTRVERVFLHISDGLFLLRKK